MKYPKSLVASPFLGFSWDFSPFRNDILPFGPSKEVDGAAGMLPPDCQDPQ
jgi:hypothetical protein